MAETITKPATAPAATPTDNRIQSGATILATCVTARKRFASARVAIWRALSKDPEGTKAAFLALYDLNDRGWNPSASVKDPIDEARCVKPGAFIDGALSGGRGAAKSQVDMANSIMDSATGASADVA